MSISMQSFIFFICLCKVGHGLMDCIQAPTVSTRKICELFLEHMPKIPSHENGRNMNMESKGDGNGVGMCQFDRSHRAMRKKF